MRNFTKALFIVLLAVLAAAPPADAGQPPATPIDQFVDCADGFWWITCGLTDPGPYPTPAHSDRVVIVADLEDGPAYLRDWDGRVAACADRGGLAYCVVLNTGATSCSFVTIDDEAPRLVCVPVPCLVGVSHPACPLL